MKRIILAAVALLVAAMPVLAAGDRDPANILAASYVFTMPKLKAYDRAIKALKEAFKKDPSLGAEVGDIYPPGVMPKTYEEIIAKFEKHPRVLAFFKKEGLNATDAVLISPVLSAVCAEMIGGGAFNPIPSHKAQVDFCKANHAAIQRLEFYQGQ